MTNHTDTPTDRFFQAYEELKTMGRTNQHRICRELHTDRRNFDKQALDHSRRILRPEWLSVLVLQYNVSADWLLTGRGWIFGE